MRANRLLLLALAWLMAVVPARANERAEVFEAWIESRPLSRYEAADALAGTHDPRARALLEKWSRRPGEADASTRNAARIAMAKLAQPARLDVATIVALPADDARRERERLVEWARRENLLDADARRQLRTWPGLTRAEREALALAAWQDERSVEDRDWLAEQLVGPHGDAASAALLLHEAGDPRGTAWLQRLIADPPSGEESKRRMMALTTMLDHEDFRSAAVFALLVARDLGGDGVHETATRYVGLAFALRCGVPGASTTWLEWFDQLEQADDRNQRELIAATIFTAGATPPAILDALVTSQHPDAASLGRWLQLVANDHDPLGDAWRAWWGSATDFARRNALLWPDGPHALDAAIERHLPSALAWVLGNPAADELDHGLASRLLTDWLERGGPERDALCATWLTDIDAPCSSALAMEITRLSLDKGVKSKAALLRQPSFGPDDSAHRALLQTELRGGRVEDDARADLEKLKGIDRFQNPAAIRAAWWLSRDAAVR